jgi:hypothetical protein
LQEKQAAPAYGDHVREAFEVDHADFGVEPLNGDCKAGEHPLCDISIGAGVNTPAAKWLRSICS